MQSILSVPKEKLSGTALVRIDLNTEDAWRMEAALPTLQYLADVAEKLVILSHRGRPKQTVSSGVPQGDMQQFSLASKAEKLEQLLGREVTFFSHFDWKALSRKIKSGKKGGVYLLENTRFLTGELKNSAELAERFAVLGDYFVNEAFAVSHRANASVVGVAERLPSYAGIELAEEVKTLSSVIGQAKKPLVIVLGGAKVLDKVEVLEFFKDKADKFLIGGAAANTLLKMQGEDVGGSLVDEQAEQNSLVQEVVSYPQLVLPSDWKTKDGAILDIGTQTIKKYGEVLASANTIIWNGPMGYTEDVDFRAGSVAVARAIAGNENAFSVAGGGETITFLRQENLQDGFSFISTGGGAMLDFLAGKNLPGLEALQK